MSLAWSVIKSESGTFSLHEAGKAIAVRGNQRQQHEQGTLASCSLLGLGCWMCLAALITRINKAME